MAELRLVAVPFRARPVRGAIATGLAAALLAACGGGRGDPGPPPVTPTAIQALDVGGLAGTVGAALPGPVRVRVTGADGRAARGVQVAWTASAGGQLSPATSTTNADGVAEARWTLGTVAGPQEAVATVGPSIVATVTATAAPDRAASVRLAADSVVALAAGTAFALTARVVDRFDNELAASTLRWSTGDAAIAAVDASGTVTARAPGRTSVLVDAGAARGEVPVLVVPPVAIGRVGGDTLRPGATVTIEGTGFVPLPGVTSLTISGVPATVTALTATRITAVVPARSALPCEPAAAGRVMVRRQLAAGRDSLVVPAAVDASLTQALAVGESVSLTDGAASACLRLAQGGRYVVSVFNAASDRFTTPTVRVRGTVGTGTAVDAPAAAPLAASRLAPEPPRALTAAQRERLAEDNEHLRLRENDRAIVARLGSPIPGLDAQRRAGGSRPRLSVAAAVPSVGDTVSLNALFASCTRGTPVRARVVHVGARSVVYEDVQSPRAGQMDTELRQVGEEFDQVQYPLLERYFGNPLAMDGRLDNDGRIAMLFTRFVNDSVPNVIGYITSCNFYGPSQAPATNQRELFYARVPRFNSAGTVVESSSEWRRQLRSTVMHEVKHLVSYAERFQRAQNGTPVFEDTWLEEATARLAEEYYARTFSGAGWKANAPYAAIACDHIPCAGDDRPRMMIKHFEALSDYYQRPGAFSPLGNVSVTDNTYYGSGWLLVRWAIDHYATDEAAFVRALTTETGATGLANLSRRTGRPAAEMVSDWTLALAADDRPGFTPRRAQLTFPSWNTRDVFRRASASDVLRFPRQFPLLVPQVAWGSFSLDVSTVRAGSAGYVELVGAPTAGAQLLELRGGVGVPLAVGLGVAILRVE